MKSTGGSTGGGQGCTTAGCLVFGGILALCAVGGYLLLHKSGVANPPGGSPTVAGQPVPGQPAGSTADNPPPATLPGGGVAVPVWYERSLQETLTKAAATFNQQQQGKYAVTLTSKGSREGMKAILYNKAQVALWNPADELWTGKLKNAWADPKLGLDRSVQVVRTSEVLFSTPIVLAAWPDRAQVLERAMASAKYKGKTWRLLRDIAVNGWASVGGPSEWGKLKLAHSHPLESNSAASMLALMYFDMTSDKPALEPESDEFVAFAKQLYGAVTDLTDTTSKALEALMNKGAARCDLCVCYEANVIKAVRAGGQNLQVLYPDPTLEARFPGAVLGVNGVSEAAAAGATQFLDHLRSKEVQEAGLLDGVRPIKPEYATAVRQAFATSPLNSLALQLQPAMPARTPSQQTTDSLVYVWNTRVARPEDRRE